MLDYVPDLTQIQAERRRRERHDSLIAFTEDLVPNYKAARVHQEVALQLEEFGRDLVAGREPRLMIFMPPRVGKSTLATVAFPAWMQGRHPNQTFIQATYGQDLSRKLSRRTRGLLRDERYEQTFQRQGLLPGSTSVDEWETLNEGGYKAVGVGSAVTGHGGNLLVDDTCKNRAEAYSAVAREKVWDAYCWDWQSRLPPGGGILLLQTRWHHNDLPGRLIKRDGRIEDGGDWKIISYPAIAEEDEYIRGELFRRKGEALDPDRYPADCKLYRDAQKNPLEWNALYQQRPTVQSGNLIKLDWFRRWTPSNVPRHFDRVVISVDCKFKETTRGSYVVIQAWGVSGANCYLLHQVRDRWGLIQTIEALRQMCARFPGAKVLVEEKANGAAVLEVLRDKIPGLHPVNPKESKEARCVAVTPAMSAGNVWIPARGPDQPPWLNGFEQECVEFPLHGTDDQVDTMTQSLADIIIGSEGLDWLTQWMGGA